MPSLPSDRSKLALAQGNQSPTFVASSAKNINAITELYDTTDLLNAKVDAHAAAVVLPHADNSITTSKYAPLSVTQDKIALGAVGAAQLASSGAVNESVNNVLITALRADVTQRGVNVKYPPTPFVAAVGDGVTDDTTALQAIINNCSSLGGFIYFPRGTYRITTPLNLVVSGMTSSSTLRVEGESQLNTIIYLDNDSASSAFIYDNGTKTVDVSSCSVTATSTTMTTTGNFNTSGIVAGMAISCNGITLGTRVISVDSDTSLTLSVAATTTSSTFTARFYLLVTTTNRVGVKDFFIKNSHANVDYLAWHSGTGISLKGCHDSEFENIRLEGFTKGLYSLGGYLNNYKTIMAHSCYDGLYCEYTSFANEFRNIRANNSGSTSAGSGITIRDSGSVSFYNLELETAKQGLVLEGVRGFTISGGNIESISNQYTIVTKGLAIIESNNQDYWTSGGLVTGIRFWCALGIVFLNGSRSIKFYGNSFLVNSAPGFTVSTSSFVNSSGDYAYIKDIDYGFNKYPTAGIPNRATLSGTLASAQSLTENGKRYASAIPYYGKYWAVGDFVYNSAVASGTNLGWVCTTASDGVSDGTATWKEVGIAGGKRAATQADSVAADIATLKTDFNALLAKLKAAGLMA